MPLTYPDLINKDGNVGSMDAKGHIYPAWGCISVTSSFENSFKDLDTSGVDLSDPECLFCDCDVSKVDLGSQLVEKYKLINMKVKQLVSEFLSEKNG